MAVHKDEIMAVLKIPILDQRYEALIERTSNIRNKFEATRKRVPFLKQYCIHRDTSKGLVNWLNELDLVLQEPFTVDSLENAEHEIEAHYKTKAAILNSSQAVEKTLENAKALEETERLSEADVKGSVLEELWNNVQESVSTRTQKLEQCVGLWTSYEENMLDVMGCLTKGEMLLAEVKVNKENKKDALKDLVERVEVSGS